MEPNILEQLLAQLAETNQRLDANQQRLEKGLEETRRHFDFVAERFESMIPLSHT